MTRYTIVLVRFRPPLEDQRGSSEAERLAKAFGISVERAEAYVQSMPCVLKRSASSEEAQGYRELLARIGAVAELRRLEAPAPTGSAIVEPTRALSSIAPPLNATAPPPTAAELDTFSFFGGVHRALLAPLRGAGIVWLLCLAGVLFVVASAAAIPCLGLFIAFPFMALYCGLFREMFGYGVSYGTGDEPRALALSDFVDLRGRTLELALNGLLIMLVAGVLLATTAYAWNATRLGDASVQVCANPNSAQGADPQAEESKAPAATTKAPPGGGCVNTPALTLGGFGLAWLMLLIQGIYWPMALTVSCLTGSITAVLRVDRIARAIYAGGWAYGFVVVLGTTGFASIIVIPTLIAAWGSRLGAITLLLLPFPWIAYLGATTSYLMGRVLATRAEELAFLDE